MQEVTFEINNIEELSKVSDLLISWRDKSNIVAFYGNMGAGKTTLIKNLCSKLGVQDIIRQCLGKGNAINHDATILRFNG